MRTSLTFSPSLVVLSPLRPLMILLTVSELVFGVPFFFLGNGAVLAYFSYEKVTVSVKLGRLSVGSAKLARSGMDDLLSSTEGGKHDYDW